MATLLMYHISGLKEAQIHMLCGMQKIMPRVVLESEESHPVGLLAGRMISAKPKKTGHFTQEMLVLADFTQQQLDEFLKSYRLSGIEPVPLKAVLTEHNQNWNAFMLFSELVREHEEMMKLQKK